MAFKDQMAKDLDNVFCADEFAETHKVDKQELLVIVDNERLQERSKKEYDGISVGELLFFIKQHDLGKRPEVNSPMRFDNRQMYVFDVREDAGLYEIILSQNRGG